MSIMFWRIFQDLRNFRNIVLLLSHSLVCSLVQDVVISDTLYFIKESMKFTC